MPGQAAMTIFIGADNSDFIRKMNQTERALKRGLGDGALQASESVATGLAGVAAAMGALGVASVKMAGEMQANKRAFSTLLGDSQKAEQFLGDLSKFAAETPFELPGLVSASKKLLAFKFDAQDIIPIMASIGDAAAMLGMGQEGIDRLTLAIGQMQAKGKVSGEEMRQLAEAGIGAWNYLADALGISVAEAMDQAEKRMIDGRTGINAVLMGMQKDFKGGMAGLSQEIPGLFSTIKDNTAAVMREMGDKIIYSLDIKTRMQGIAAYLGNFATYVKNSGIDAALRNMIPKEVTLAIFAISGALIGAAIPALKMFAIGTIRALVPLLPFIAAGAALGAVAWVIWQAWQPLGDLFANTWTRVVAYTQQKWAEIQVAVYSGVQRVLQAIQPILGLFGGGMQSAVSGWMSSLADKITVAGQAAQAAAERGQAASEGINKAFSGIGDSLLKGANEIKDSISNINTTFTGLHGNVGNVGPSKADVKAWEDLQKKAEQVSKAIEQEWVQTTKTELEQLDIWRAQQLKALDETRAANENYERDVLRVEAVYADRRVKIVLDEAKKKASIWDQAADAARNLQNKIAGIGLTGVSKEKFDILTDAENQITDMERKYRDWAASYAAAGEAERAEMRRSWEAHGILFEINEQGMVDFAAQKALERVAINDEADTKIANLKMERRLWEESMEKARNEGDIQAFAEALQNKQAILAENLAGQQEMIDFYYETWKESHRSAMSYMAEGMKGLYGGLTTFFTDVLSGTKSIGEAWSALGKSIVQIIAKMVAQWIASRITMWAMEKLFGTQQQTLATAQGAATAAAWAPAAAMVSLATMGANAGPAMAGIGLTTAFAVGLSTIPGLATGGITTGPTIAQIGEGHHQEAVLPLDRRTFERMGLTNGEQQPGDTFHISLQMWDTTSADKWLMERGAALVKSIKRQARSFNVAEVGI